MANNPDLYSKKPSTIVVYSTSWCPDCKRAKKVLNENKIKYLEVDIGKDHEATKFLEHLSKARIHIPTLIFPDGSILIEPEDEELEKKLKIKK